MRSFNINVEITQEGLLRVKLTPDRKYNSCIYLIAKNAGKIVGSLYRSRKYLTPAIIGHAITSVGFRLQNEVVPLVMCWCSPVFSLSSFERDQIVYPDLWVRNYFQAYNHYHKNETFLTSRYSVAFTIGYLLMSHILWSHQLRPLQLGPSVEHHPYSLYVSL